MPPARLLEALRTLAIPQHPFSPASVQNPSPHNQVATPSIDVAEQRGTLFEHRKHFRAKVGIPWLRVKSGCKCKDSQLDFIDWQSTRWPQANLGLICKLGEGCGLVLGH